MCEVVSREPRDPHVAWALQVRLLRACYLEEPGFVEPGRLAHQTLDLLALVVNTPSNTLGGVREQMVVADLLLNEPDQRVGPVDLAGRAVRAALEGVDRMLAKGGGA